MHAESCGCLYEEHTSGARYRVSRCEDHMKRFPIQNFFDENNYREMGVLDGRGRHVSEFIAGCGELPVVDGGYCIEFGSGVSPYVDMIRNSGYSYHAVDSSQFACDFMRKRGISVEQSFIDDFVPVREYDIVIAAHVLEHVPNADTAMEKMRQSIIRNGLLYLIVPDDSDLHNQDHLWFFNEASIRSFMDMHGFYIHSMKSMQIIEREKFIYCVTEKK